MSMRPILLLGGDGMAAAARAAAASSGAPQTVPAGLQSHPGLATSSALASPYQAYAPGLQLAKYPEVALFSQLGQLFPKSGTQAGGSPAGGSIPEPSSSRPAAQRTSSDGKSSYASRHQAAEQRRRTRINDRLDRLRKIVPHAERANTAAFLEEVINYVVGLQHRVLQLESHAVQAPEVPASNASALREHSDEEEDEDRSPVTRPAVPKITKKRKTLENVDNNHSPAKKVAT